MLTCTKLYSDIPFAHRQPKHDGHCAFIHGHNWSISLTFSAKELDCNGFVVDFGKLKYIKNWIEENLDHSCLLNEADPCINELQNSKYFKFFIIPDCSCEGLSIYLFNELNKLVAKNEGGRVRISLITVTEDSKNYTTYSE